MKIAEDIWNIKYKKFGGYNINEFIRGVLGKMLKRLNCLNKKVQGIKVICLIPSIALLEDFLLKINKPAL